MVIRYRTLQTYRTHAAKKHHITGATYRKWAFKVPAGLMPLLLSLLASGATPSTGAPLPEWAEFHGKHRDNKSTETGLLKQWPENGPPLLWTAKGMGIGFSTVSIKNGTLYTAGIFSNNTFVTALDFNGKIKWQTPNGTTWIVPENMQWAKSKGYKGSRATPTINDGLAYHLNGTGMLIALDAENGKKVWALNLPEKFDGKVPTFGYSESVLIDGNNLICCPGGTKGHMVALNKKTGEIVWVMKDIIEMAANTSPMLITDHGIRQILTMTTTWACGVNADTGKLLWKHQHINRFKETCVTPIYKDESVFVTSGYKYGCELLKLTYDKKSVSKKRVWHNKDMDNLHGGVILHEGYLFGTGDRKNLMFCLDFNTGKEMWRQRGVVRGAVGFADGLIYYLNEKGIMSLIRPSPEKYDEVSRFKVSKGGPGPFWAHPVICDGRLYIRHSDQLYAYDISSSGHKVNM